MKKKIQKNTLLILVDTKDREIGRAEKFLVHQKGLKHRAFSIFIFNAIGEILIQKRNKNKYHSGGLWTNTCCGHPNSDGKILRQAQKRLKEEMGIDTDLKGVFVFSYRVKLGKLIENEYDHVFVGKYDGDFKPDLDEVEDWKWIALSELESDIKKNPQKYTYWFKLIIKKYLNRFYDYLFTSSLYCQTSIKYDFLLRKRVNEVNFFLPSAGCTKAKKYGPCLICGFYRPWEILGTLAQKPTVEEILNIFQTYILPQIKFHRAEVINFYIGGSILDEKEFPLEALLTIINNYLPKTIKKISFESRPEYITERVIRKLKQNLPKRVKVMVYLGVETSNNKFRNKILLKDISNLKFIEALKKLKKYNIACGAHLLAGLPGISKKESIDDAIESIKWCYRNGFDEISLNPTVVTNQSVVLKKLYKNKKFDPLTLSDIIAVSRAVRSYPVTVAELDNDPPCIAGLEGSKKEWVEIKKFNQRLGFNKTVALQAQIVNEELDWFANIASEIYCDKSKAEHFSSGLLIILNKVLHSLFGDIWETADFYGVPRKKYEDEIMPFLTNIQVLVYIADVAVEYLEDDDKVLSCLDKISGAIDSLVESKEIKDKTIKKLFKEVYQFLLRDREVRQKRMLLKKNKILETLHFKVSDLLALMRMAVELGGEKVPEKEWRIWRQIELIREFIDDQEDRDEDIKEDSEQFNSIVQLEKQGLSLKKVVGDECKKLQKMIAGISDVKKKERFEKVSEYLIKERIPQNFSF